MNVEMFRFFYLYVHSRDAPQFSAVFFLTGNVLENVFAVETQIHKKLVTMHSLISEKNISEDLEMVDF